LSSNFASVGTFYLTYEIYKMVKLSINRRMERRNPIYKLIEKYGKEDISENAKSEMIEIVINNPKEIVYIPKEVFLKISQKQAELELEEDLYGLHARGIKKKKT
jgi:hypothetical protein